MSSTYFKDNLLSYLPAEFAIQDARFGDLASFLEVVAISMDEFDQFIEDFTSIFDVDECPPLYLPYLAKMLNYPLNERDDIASQRLQLKNAVEWYKRKGLHESFRILFYSLGYVINLVELWTKDYIKFYRYPGTWGPPVFLANIPGTSTTPISISYATRNMRVRIDGGSPVDIHLTVGENRDLTSIAAEIDSSLEPVGGDCSVIDNELIIKSRLAGAASSVRLIELENSAYSVLGLHADIKYGIDYKVPDDWPDLLENGGDWYRSPHFGIEVYSIKDYVTDPNEFEYVRERIELVRPAHTVLEFLDYVKTVSDAYNVKEDDLIGVLEPTLVDSWPFPICVDRGRNCTYEYLRNGLVPDRSEETRLSYRHIRNADDNCFRRNSFTYEYTALSRNIVGGPTQMPDRGAIRFYRGGFPSGQPKRFSCESREVETIDMTLGYYLNQNWCMALLRDGGAYYRNKPDTYFRDGSFSKLTSRNPFHFNRDGWDTLVDRSGCTTPRDADLDMMFERSDLPGVYFRSLSAMSDPNILGITDVLPGPGELGPTVG